MYSVAPPPRKDDGLKGLSSKRRANLSWLNLSRKPLMPPGIRGTFSPSRPKTAKDMRKSRVSSTTID
eukprot:2602798-Amphidinium_carterae.1